MTKVEQMEELIKKYQENQELQKEVAALFQPENPEDTTLADQWLADHGYEFTLMELVDHLEDASDLTAEELETVAGGRSDREKSDGSAATVFFSAIGVVIGIWGGNELCKKIQG